MSDLRPISYFLGIEVISTVVGYYLSQHRYIEDLIARSGLTDTRTATTPMEPCIQLHSTYGTPLDDPSRYRHIVGSLVYLTITRPDVAHVFHSLSQFISAPTSVHYSHLLRVLHYFRDTITCCQFSSSSQFQLNAYTDYTWASNPVDR